jgi:hypothetical protein
LTKNQLGKRRITCDINNDHSSIEADMDDFEPSVQFDPDTAFPVPSLTRPSACLSLSRSGGTSTSFRSAERWQCRHSAGFPRASQKFGLPVKSLLGEPARESLPAGAGYGTRTPGWRNDPLEKWRAAPGFEIRIGPATSGVEPAGQDVGLNSPVPMLGYKLLKPLVFLGQLVSSSAHFSERRISVEPFPRQAKNELKPIPSPPEELLG